MTQKSTVRDDSDIVEGRRTALTVLMMPDFRTRNPYQSVLSKAISDLGNKVSFPYGYRRLFPLYRAVREQAAPVNVLHLHWLTPYLRGKHLVSYLIYALKLYTDVCLVRLRGVPIVWTIHNSLSHESQFPRLELWAMRWIASAASRVIVHSVAALQQLRQELRLSAAKMVVIPHGHYREVYKPAVDKQVARERLGLPAESLIYLCFGLVRRYKNIEGLLKAWSQSHTLSHINVLVLAGEALDLNYAEEIRGLAQSNTNVILRLRHIPAEEVHLYFSAADIVVLPFSRTLTSGSLLLAMSFDKPIIAPRFDVIVEALGPAGALLFDPSEADALHRALGAAASADLAAIAERVRPQCDRLSWSAIAEMTVSTYDAACQSA
jgi:beta-1,4-mannosyltransferase